MKGKKNMIGETGQILVLRKDPIIATFRDSARFFEVRCEATGNWLTSVNRGAHVYSDESGKIEMLETLKNVEYQFHRVKEEFGKLIVEMLVGVWLSDGRLVSPYCKDCKEGVPVKGYYGKQSEILSMWRRIEYLRDEVSENEPDFPEFNIDDSFGLKC